MIESDHDDDKFVDCAFAANATYIVSDDKHFDVLKEISFTRLLVLKLKRYIIVFFSHSYCITNKDSEKRQKEDWEKYEIDKKDPE